MKGVRRATRGQADRPMQFFDFGTIFFIVAAVVIFIQLRSVLGRRTGNERPPRDPFRRDRPEQAAEAPARDNIVSLPKRKGRAAEPKAEPAPAESGDLDAIAKPGSELNAGLKAIRAADAGFDPKTFVNGVRMAYEMIVTAFADGDRKTLKNLLSREVYDGFVGAIAEREQAGQKVKSSFVGIDKADIVAAEMKGSEAYVTVRVASQIISSTVDAAGAVVEGDPENVAEVKDVWTFSRDTRSRDPNWKLVATEAED